MKVERTTRRVIENKLLDALSDERTVAILASEQDLEDMIASLYGYQLADWVGPNVGPSNTLSWQAHLDRRLELAKGLKQLKAAAFPK